MEWLSEFAKDPFYELAIILFLAAILGGIGRMLRQPLIVMFIVLGIIAGPAVLDVVQSHENIHLLAQAGIAILLFIVGLKLDVRLIKSIGKVALTTGLGQVIFTSVIGYFIGLALGFSSLHSFYIAVALTFSSTIIIVKLLSDKKEIDSLHGQISIGFLIIQDIVVIIVMIILSSISKEEGMGLWYEALKTGGLTLLLVAFTLVMMRWVIPKLTFFLAKSQELLALSAIAWAIALAALSEIIGFSAEVGAFLAGVSLASSPFKEAVSGRLNSVRDFLLLFFFVNLGANLNLAIIGDQITPAIIFSLFVLIGNPIIVLIIMGIMGYRKRTAFLAGLTVAQISEFSLIFAGLGLQIGHLSEETVGLITLVGLITIGLSTYLILYSYPIYDFLAPALKIFERKHPQKEPALETKQAKHDVLIFGLGRFGSKIAEFLDEHDDVSYIGVDFDPLVVKQWQAKGKSIIYGDIEDPEILEHIPYKNVSCVLSTIHDSQLSMKLVRSLRKNKFKGRIFLTATNENDFHDLSKCMADQVLMLHKMAAENFYNSFLSNLLQNRENQQCRLDGRPVEPVAE
jgi:Kef-type K+ transport system membrane component KefB